MKTWLLLSSLAALMLLGSTPAFARFVPPPPCKNPYTHDQEITEGAKVAATVYQQQPVLNESDPVSRYVSSLGARLVTHAPGGDQWPFTFHVIASSEINAFALPGGAIFINLGTVQAAESEAQLAGVISHEISHVLLRHATCNIGKQQKRSIGYGIGAIASAVVLGDSALGQMAQTGIGDLKGLQFLHMSRGSEMQADLLGTDTLYDTGYDPRGLPQFFEIIQAKYGAGGAQMLSDHPNPGNRTQYVNSEIATLPPNSHPLVTSTEFTRIHTAAMAETSFDSKQMAAGAWKNGAYATGPGAAGVTRIDSRTPARTPANPGQPTTNPNGSATGIPALRADQLAQIASSGRLTFYQGQNYALSYPTSWKITTDADHNQTFAPTGGAGSFGLAYGLLVGTERQADNGVNDAASLSAATVALARKLSGQNGASSAAQPRALSTAGGQLKAAVDLSGQSPVAESGATLPEHDWLVTVMRPDGDLNYLVFVSPERDFTRLQPTFQRILATFKAQ